ncbi:MAG: sulfurtransferase complex subunit TusC [Buchnera aphidicola (Tetraneura akinire)]|nr:sulfurtransferase complex subunit TusC [Buchnera sp. (in: enterobacteria)]
MKSIAFTINRSIHGSNIGIEGLNVILAAATIQNNIGIFFIGDGILQILNFKNSENIFSRNYPAYFLILVTYGIKKFYVCKKSLLDRDINIQKVFFIDVIVLDPNKMREKIDSYDLILNF